MAEACSTVPTTADVRLQKERHIKYWVRCLKTLLPAAYTSNDSNRMYLAFFIIAALDLLGALQNKTSDDERRDYVNWIYHCQHPNGGFRMYSGTDLGDKTTGENAKWDPANIPATYFALASLLILGDNFERVRRRETLQFLTRLQREDGSFGETLIGDTINGGRDTRYGLCATGVRYILRGNTHGAVDDVPDVHIDDFVECVRRSETYDGGISDGQFHEAHAGFTFCALAALSLLGRLSTSRQDNMQPVGPSDPQLTLRWLASRQTATLDPDDAFDTEGDETDTPETCHDAHSTVHPFMNGNGIPLGLSKAGEHSYNSRPTSNFAAEWAGMNGRCNKVADTCYAFWVCASMRIMDQPGLCDRKALKRYLLEKTAHSVLGGFGKFPGDLPDLYHSYLGLAALSLAGYQDLKGLDGAMCISQEARGRLPGLWRQWGLENG